METLEVQVTYVSELTGKSPCKDEDLNLYRLCQSDSLPLTILLFSLWTQNYFLREGKARFLCPHRLFLISLRPGKGRIHDIIIYGPRSLPNFVFCASKAVLQCHDPLRSRSGKSQTPTSHVI